MRKITEEEQAEWLAQITKAMYDASERLVTMQVNAKTVPLMNWCINSTCDTLREQVSQAVANRESMDFIEGLQLSALAHTFLVGYSFGKNGVELVELSDNQGGFLN